MSEKSGSGPHGYVPSPREVTPLASALASSMASEQDPASPRGTPPRTHEARSAYTGERVCRILLIDYHTIAAAFGCAHALHAHVVTTCKPSALQDLADIGAANGICSHAIYNIFHIRDWFIRLVPLTVDVDAITKELCS